MSLFSILMHKPGQLSRITLIIILCFWSSPSFAQEAVTSVVLADTNYAVFIRNNVKGAGLRNSGGNLFSSWDSTGNCQFTINYNSSSTLDSRRLVQAQVSSLSNPLYPVSIPDAICKIRRQANSTITDDRDHFNLWMRCSSVPAVNDTTGTFYINSPYLSSAEDCFLSGNLNNGIDNVFSNDINYAHEGNIERIDLISPSGFSVFNSTAIDEAGFIILDRGVGDNFSIAAITALDTLDDPIAYTPLLKVPASAFGSSNIIASSPYVIFNYDSNFGAGRPSTSNSQGQRAVFISLSALGLDSVGTKFYGISVFADDIDSSYNLVNYLSFPNNTGSGGGLDITAHFGLFKTGLSALPVQVLHFEGKAENNFNQIDFIPAELSHCLHVSLEYANEDGHFVPLTQFAYRAFQTFSFQHPVYTSEVSAYRLKFEFADARIDYSQTLSIDRSNKAFLVYPNPFTNTFTIDLPATLQAKDLQIELQANNGQIIVCEIRRINRNQLEIKTGDLPAGLYFLTLSNGKNERISRMKMMVN